METTVPAEPLAVSGRGLDALRTTRPWALVVGIISLIYAVFAIVNAVYWSVAFSSHALPAAPEAAKFTPYVRFFYLGSGLIEFLISGALGWFALSYGRRLGRMMRMRAANELEAAFWWQRRYWTLEGVLIISILVIAVLTAIVLPILAASYHH